MRRIFIATGLVALALSIQAPLALADDSGVDVASRSDTPTGSHVEAAGSYKETAADKAKLAALTEYMRLLNSGDVKAAKESLSGTPLSSASLALAVAGVDQPPVSYYMNLTQVGQNTGYYCGPASGYMVLLYRHGTGYTSRYNGNAPGQANIANTDHMQTDYYGSTDWSRGQWIRGVNRWEGGTYYTQMNSPDLSTYQWIVSWDVGYMGYPIAVDTVEFVNGNHYNNHPNRLIGHWIVGHGYTSSGASVTYADSSTSLWGASYGVQPHFTAASSSFIQYVQNNGVAW